MLLGSGSVAHGAEDRERRRALYPDLAIASRPTSRRGGAFLADEVEDFAGGLRDVGAGTVDRAGPGGEELGVILRRDDAAADEGDVLAALRAQSGDQCGDQRLVGGGLA